MSEEEKRKFLNEIMDWPEWANEEIGRMPFGEKTDWVMYSCPDCYGGRTWFAKIEESV